MANSTNVQKDFKLLKLNRRSMSAGPAPRPVSSRASNNTEHLSDVEKMINQLLRENRSVIDPEWIKVSGIGDHRHRNRSQLLLALKDLHTELLASYKEGEFFKNVDNRAHLRTRMQTIYTEMVATDLKFCCSKTVDSYFWKILFYIEIQIFKRCTSTAHQYKCQVLQIINNGIEFYEKLIEIVENSFKIKIIGRDFENSELPPSYVLVILQKFTLNIGDMHRYMVSFECSNSYENAIEYYQTAQSLMPTNGFPYNQLAVLSIATNKTLDAVYYHIRSLLSSNPIQSAKESLNILFDNIRRKYDLKENLIKPANGHTKSDKTQKKRNDSQNPLRTEIWVHPDGSRQLHQVAASEVDSHLNQKDEDAADPLEIKKNFIYSYLNVHGKLYTKTGMENFEACAINMLEAFQKLLNLKKFPFSNEWLLKIMAINIFSLHIYEAKALPINNGTNSVYCYPYEISHFMVGLMAKSASHLLRIFNRDSPISSKELSTLCQGMKIWFDWLKLHEKTWRSLKSNRCNDFFMATVFLPDPWQNVAEFMTKLSEISLTIPCNSTASQPLSEDTFLRGFLPLENNIKENLIVSNSLKGQEQEVRLQVLFKFGLNYLCQISPPVLKRVKTSDQGFRFERQESVRLPSDSIEYFEKFDYVSSSEDENLTSSWLTDKSPTSENTSISNSLLQKKTELEKQQKLTENYQSKLETVLLCRQLNIEVHPKYLIPDTNCFIDFLKEIEQIAQHRSGHLSNSTYLIVIPLVVIKELEGLAKGFRSTNETSSSEIRHGQHVSLQSQQSLKFIKTKNPAVRWATSKGSFLPTTTGCAMEEETGDVCSNDDVILSSAVNLCRLQNLDRVEGDVLHIRTKVVLLTTDRNLRVKALANNIAVSQIPTFLKWANLKVRNHKNR